MGLGMFRTTKADWILFWGVILTIAGFLFGTGFVLGRVSSTWPSPRIEWRLQ
jgi:hypothetical protein